MSTEPESVPFANAPTGFTEELLNLAMTNPEVARRSGVRFRHFHEARTVREEQTIVDQHFENGNKAFVEVKVTRSVLQRGALVGTMAIFDSADKKHCFVAVSLPNLDEPAKKAFLDGNASRGEGRFRALQKLSYGDCICLPTEFLEEILASEPSSILGQAKERVTSKMAERLGKLYPTSL